MSVKEEALNINEKLWVLVQIKDSICALDSTRVEAISLLESDIIQMPNSDDINVGIIQFRGSVLPIVDLRRMLGMESREKERQDFDHMLDIRKQDHINWVDELRRCTHEHADFRLATDPHDCAFGKWYYNYRPSSHGLAFHLKKVEEPHRKLHETAVAIISSLNDADHGEARADSILKKETDVYKTQVMRLLDETKHAFSESYHNMIVVLSDGATSCGLLVDEVLAVETLDPIAHGNQPSCVDSVSLVEQVAKRKNSQELVMVLNQKRMLSVVPQEELIS